MARAPPGPSCYGGHPTSTCRGKAGGRPHPKMKARPFAKQKAMPKAWQAGRSTGQDREPHHHSSPASASDVPEPERAPVVAGIGSVQAGSDGEAGMGSICGNYCDSSGRTCSRNVAQAQMRLEAVECSCATPTKHASLALPVPATPRPLALLHHPLRRRRHFHWRCRWRSFHLMRTFRQWPRRLSLLIFICHQSHPICGIDVVAGDCGAPAPWTRRVMRRRAVMSRQSADASDKSTSSEPATTAPAAVSEPPVSHLAYLRARLAESSRKRRQDRQKNHCPRGHTRHAICSIGTRLIVTHTAPLESLRWLMVGLSDMSHLLSSTYAGVETMV